MLNGEAVACAGLFYAFSITFSSSLFRECFWHVPDRLGDCGLSGAAGKLKIQKTICSCGKIKIFKRGVVNNYPSP